MTNDPNLDWTEEDDKLMVSFSCEYRYDWKKVSKKFLLLRSKKVTPLFLRNRYKYLKENDKTSRGPLTETDDMNIVRAIERWGIDSWDRLYEAVPNANKI
mmetsp:Transcript_25743/g.22733  ORF Transcript_25743/g.22733 Transcript_25743/m.22733 type:complete len:100 (+) Transcript_25743:165-464(+)